MDVVELHRRSAEEFVRRVRAVAPDQWGLPTPCDEWDVRALVNHVVGEDRWTVPLMAGATIEEVGERFEGDLLGDDPLAAAEHAANAAAAAVVAPVLTRGTVHLSYGEESAAEYAWQLAADHLIHGWDVAASTGGDRRFDPAMVEAVAGWFAGREEIYRQGGAIAGRPAGVRAADPQARLLAAFGRDPDWSPALGVAKQFTAAFGSRDLGQIMSLVTGDVIFESTSPAPDGRRVTGQSAVRAEWERLFRDTADVAFETEELYAAGDRAVVRWRYSWRDPDGSPGHVRGVDLLRCRGGKIAEKLSYVKG